MTEIAILVRAGGVRKTQIIAPPGEHAEGFSLYERLLPHIRRINDELTTPAPKHEEVPPCPK